MQNDSANPKSVFPAPIYSDTVLSRIFSDAQRLFLTPLIEIEYAHTLMLAKQGILSRATARECLRALDILSNPLNLEDLRTTRYDGSVEDLFFLIERRLAGICGVDNAGRIHTARSRNDIDMTMYRIVLRQNLLNTLDALLTLRTELLRLASDNRGSLMPAYTHNQPAQPTTLGHYLMAVIEVLERDTERLLAAYTRVNRSPLGACAITTTGFPIDRNYTAQLLGFDGLQTNSYGAIASIDYLTESCSTLAVAMLNIGRFTQDLLLWSTVEFNYLRLSDGYVQISSIMPQKRNPVPLEHVRTLASCALTESQAALGSLHNTPFADMNDSEDSFQPLIALAFDDATRALTLLTGALSEATFNTAHMRKAAQGNFLTVTELADTIVRTTGTSFHHAHTVVSAAVRQLAGNYDAETMAATVRALLANDPEQPLQIDLDTLRQSLDAQHFIDIRTIPGGPALSALNPEIARAFNQLNNDTTALTAHKNALQAAKLLLRTDTDTLLSDNEAAASN